MTGIFKSIRFWSAMCAFAMALTGCSEDEGHDVQNNPGQNDPGQNNPGQTTPGQNNPGQTTPGQNNPGQTPQGCGDVPDTGKCNGNVVDYCENGELKSYNCAQEGKICGVTSAETNSFGCIDGGNSSGGGCGDVPDTGKCNGNVVDYCENGELKSYNCAQEGKICGVTSAETNSFGCIASTVPPEPPAPGDLKTAEDWARARIAGSVSSEDAFNAIAYNGGFPVITDDNTVIFMHWSEDGDWKVVGDFNHWDVNSTAMTKNGDIWYAEVAMPADVATNNYYKYYNVNAPEDKKYLADPFALRYGYTEDGEISYIVKPNKPHLVRYHNFKSPQGLKPRTLRIYMPAGDGPFDVLYAHDAQNLYGPGGDYGSWKVEENMETAEASFMIVGMDNMGEERLSEYAFADEDLTAVGYGNIKARGQQYAKFVQETVRPFIESHYNVTKKAGLMGSSMGGLISLYIAHLYPEAYKVVLALSPTTAWGRFSHDDGTTIEDLYAPEGDRNFILYLDHGGHAPEGGVCPSKLGTLEASNDEFSRDCYCYTHSFFEKLKSMGYKENEDLFYEFVKGAQHNEAAWADRLVKPLTIFKDARN